MDKQIRFRVFGKPEPRGSKTAMPLYNRRGQLITTKEGRPIINMVDTNDKSESWMKLVAATALRTMLDEERVLFEKSVGVNLACEFILERPGGHFGKGRNAGTLKRSAPAYPIVKPDLDKLKRGTQDALSGVVINDDNQVVSYDGTQKRYCKIGEEPGVIITVRAKESAQLNLLETA